MARRAARRPTRRFYISVAVLVAVIGFAAFLLLRSPKEAEIDADGEMSFDRDISCIIVRDETVIESEDYSMINFLATEGDKVTKGAQIAEVYRIGFQEDQQLKNYIDIMQEIHQYQTEELYRGIGNPELNEINAKIQNMMTEISGVIQGRSNADLVTLERRIKELLEQRVSFLADNTQATDKLREMYARRDEITKVMSEYRQMINAEEAGVVSFYIDGKESRFTPDNLITADQMPITLSEFEETKNSVVEKKSTADSQMKPIYRLVTNYKWYCAVVAKSREEEIPEFRVNQDVKMIFEGYYSQEFAAKVLTVRNTVEGAKVYVLEMSSDVSPLVNVRQADAKIKIYYQGVKVPVSGLYMEDGKTYVKIIQNNQAKLVEVEIQVQNETDAIVQAIHADEAGLLANKTRIMLK